MSTRSFPVCTPCTSAADAGPVLVAKGGDTVLASLHLDLVVPCCPARLIQRGSPSRPFRAFQRRLDCSAMHLLDVDAFCIALHEEIVC